MVRNDLKTLKRGNIVIFRAKKSIITHGWCRTAIGDVNGGLKSVKGSSLFRVGSQLIDLPH